MKKFFERFLLLFFAVFLTACNSNAGADISNGLYENKTKYVGDNSKVVKIVDGQEYQNGAKYSEIHILSDNEPYGLEVYLEDASDLNEELLFKNAAITFSLIDNVSEIFYYDADSEREIAKFERQDVEEKLSEDNLTLEKLSESEESLEKFIYE